MTFRERVGRRLLLALRPPRDRRRDEHGRCSVCGFEGRLVFNSWMLPRELRRDLGDARLVASFAARESLFCRGCGSSLRVRRLSDVLLEHYADGASTLAELVAEARFRALSVAEINSVGLIHSYLARLPNLRYSEFRPGAPLGEDVDGVRNEDIERLSYADAAFDLVLTSDTLEHVPDPARALGETRRVLRPGGRHVFTVPLVPSRPRSTTRASAGADGSPRHHAEPQYHGRGSGPFALVSRKQDHLVYTDFALDVVDELTRAGFASEIHFLDPSRPDADVALVLCATAVSAAG
jgi:SAM-dependent methyltransferase